MRLLVLGCSQRKKLSPAELPAIERYDGVLFRVTRKWHTQASSSDLHMMIVSAKYGLLGASDLIRDYDQRMTQERARILRHAVNSRLREQLMSARYHKVFLGLGGSYRSVIDVELLDDQDISIEWASGPIGAQAAQLKDWLWGAVMDPQNGQQSVYPVSPAQKTPGIVRLRGKELPLTPEEVVAQARRALATNSAGADNFTSWYSLIDEQRVSTKWLVRALSGLSLGAFSTSEARRVLAQLGIATYYTPAGRTTTHRGTDSL